MSGCIRVYLETRPTPRKVKFMTWKMQKLELIELKKRKN